MDPASPQVPGMKRSGGDTTSAFYLGHRLRITETDVAVYSPDGVFMSLQPNVKFARLLVRRARRLQRLEQRGAF